MAALKMGKKVAGARTRPKAARLGKKAAPKGKGGKTSSGE